MVAIRSFAHSAPRWWRWLVFIAIAWGLLRLGVQIYTFLSPMSDQVGVDLKAAYLEAGRNFLRGESLYPQTVEAMEGLYFYAPPLVVVFALLTLLPEPTVVFLWLGLCLAAYLGLFFTWDRIFSFLQLESARRTLFFSIPLWIAFSPLWDDATYLNIYTLMALIGSLFIEAILRERLWAASACLTLILATKPQWGFAVLLLLLLRRYRFFGKLVGGAILGYLSLVALGMVASQPTYLWEQYGEYFRFLVHLSRLHPWRTAADSLLGYNHSILQITIFLGGEKARILGQLIKYALLAPAAGLFLWSATTPQGRKSVVSHPLAWAFYLYLAAFLWLDLLWELYLSIVIFPYLLSLNLTKGAKRLAKIVFLPYALLDIYRVLIYAAGSPFLNGSYLAWDFSAYLPVIMIVLLTFYFLLLRFLWQTTRTIPQEATR